MYIRLCDHNIAGLDMLLARIALQKLFSQCITALAALFFRERRDFRLFQTCCHTGFGILDQPPVGDNVEEILGDCSNLEALSVDGNCLLFYINGNDIPAFAYILNAVTGQEENAAVEGVAEEDTGEALGDDASYAVMGEHGCSLFTGRTAAEVGSGNEDISRLNGGAEFRFEKLEGILLHFLNSGDGASLAGDYSISVNIVSEFPDFAVKDFIHGSSSLNLFADGCQRH